MLSVFPGMYTRYSATLTFIFFCFLTSYNGATLYYYKHTLCASKNTTPKRVLLPDLQSHFLDPWWSATPFPAASRRVISRSLTFSATLFNFKNFSTQGGIWAISSARFFVRGFKMTNTQASKFIFFSRKQKALCKMRTPLFDLTNRWVGQIAINIHRFPNSLHAGDVDFNDRRTCIRKSVTVDHVDFFNRKTHVVVYHFNVCLFDYVGGTKLALETVMILSQSPASWVYRAHAHAYAVHDASNTYSPRACCLPWKRLVQFTARVCFGF